MDSKGRQSSTSKFFGRRHKDKDRPSGPGPSETRPPAESHSPPGSAHGSLSSRHSNPHRHSASTSQASVDRPVSLSAEGIFAKAGPISNFDPTQQLEPHHLNQGGGDFHQYPVFDPSQMPSHGYGHDRDRDRDRGGPRSRDGPPRPPPHASGSTTMTSQADASDRVSVQQWGARDSSRNRSNPATSNSQYYDSTRASSDQASVYSNDSRTRGNSIYYPKSNTNSQTTFSSIGLDAGSLLPMATSAPRDSHRHNLLHSNQSSPFSSGRASLWSTTCSTNGSKRLKRRVLMPRSKPAGSYRSLTSTAKPRRLCCATKVFMASPRSVAPR